MLHMFTDPESYPHSVEKPGNRSRPTTPSTSKVPRPPKR